MATLLRNQYASLHPIYHNKTYNIYPIEKHKDNKWYVAPHDTHEYGVSYETTPYHPYESIMCMHCSSILHCISFIEDELKAIGVDIEDYQDGQSAWGVYLRDIDYKKDTISVVIIFGGTILSLLFPLIIEVF